MGSFPDRAMLCDMKLRLGGRDHAEGDFVVWAMGAEQSPPGVAAAIQDGTVLDAGSDPSAEDAIKSGHHVVVTVTGEEPGLLAAVSVYAWLGVRLFRVPAPAIPAVRQVLDMVASIKGVRQPARTRRGLA
jgi:hypothetical protein